MAQNNTYILTKPAAMAQAIRFEELLKSIKAEVAHAQKVVDTSQDEQTRIMQHLSEGAISQDEATKAYDAADGPAANLSRHILAVLGSAAKADDYGFLTDAIEAAKKQ